MFSGRPKKKCSGAITIGFKRLCFWAFTAALVGCASSKKLSSTDGSYKNDNAGLLAWVPLGADAVLELEPQRLRASTHFESIFPFLGGEIDGVQLDSIKDAKSLVIASYGVGDCLLYTSPSPRDATLSRMPSSA